MTAVARSVVSGPRARVERKIRRTRAWINRDLELGIRRAECDRFGFGSLRIARCPVNREVSGSQLPGSGLRWATLRKP